MNHPCRGIAAAGMRTLARSLAKVFVTLSVPLWVAPATAQFSSGPVELSDSVSLDEADSETRTHLERIKAYVADAQWDEAVESLRRIMEGGGGKMIAITPQRFVNLADYCHVQIASLPQEGLALYRQRVDASAKAAFDQALAARDADRLANLVDTQFCSSWGDDALWAVGEIELERGNYSAARHAWEMLIELPPSRIPAPFFDAARQQQNVDEQTAAALDQYYVLQDTSEQPYYQLRVQGLMPDADAAALVRFWKECGLPFTRLTYPETSLSRSDIRARLILVSIMEGSLQRAREELDAYRRLHPGAQGRLAGRTVDYADTLEAMVATAQGWPEPQPKDDWLTFAGSYTRNRATARDLDLGPQAWKPVSLGEPIAADSANSRAFSLRRIGEDAQRLMSYHPLVTDDLVLVNNQSQIFAFDRKTGQPAWQGDPMRPPGEIYSDETSRQTAPRMNRGLGVPRFTMTVQGGKLFARMGSQVTSHPLESYESRTPGYLVCLDLAAQGRLVWKPDGRLLPDDEDWAFEGSPVVDGPNLYVAMRKSDVRPQSYVACFDVESGRRRWRTLVCAAETAAGGQLAEITHNLLTYHQGTLYLNTNLGAVAALSARDGHLLWASIYPRAKKATPDGKDRRTAHFYRDLNPCVYDRGKLLVAPADGESIFALDAASGEMLWESRLPEDVVHLLGVAHGNLLASGDSLWWLDVEGGKVLKRWPDSSPLGHGRGILMGDQVIWPTNEALYRFDQRVTTDGPTYTPIQLSERRAAGGNLVAAGDLLLIATPEILFAFRQQGQPPKGGPDSSDRRAPPAKP